MAATGGPTPPPAAVTPAESRRRATREFFTGAGFIARGLAVWITDPRAMLMGVIPGLIVGAVYLAGLIFTIANIETLAAWATPFADDWSELGRRAVRLLTQIGLLGFVLLIAIFTFTAITLTVGDPFYEKIWRRVEARRGGDQRFHEVTFWRGVLDSCRILLVTVPTAILLFAAGFIPLVGQIASPVLSALLGGWFLTTEVTARVFDARGFSLAGRRRMLRSRRPLSLGFGCATYLLFLIPFGAVVLMPSIVAGATLLGREIIDGSDASAGDAPADDTPADGTRADGTPADDARADGRGAV